MLRSYSRLPKVAIDHGHSYYGHYLITTWAGSEQVLSDVLPPDGSDAFLPVQQTYEWFLRLAECLLKLHHTCAQIVHGDLKPDNLALTNDKCRLILIDFGYSWTIAETSSRCNDQLGSYFYASPEQWSKEATVGPYSDQFSASVVFYQALTNRLPYEGTGGQALALAKGHGKSLNYVPPSQFNAAVWPELDRVLQKGLALNIEDRYGTTRSWLAALQAAADPDKVYHK